MLECSIGIKYTFTDRKDAINKTNVKILNMNRDLFKNGIITDKRYMFFESPGSIPSTGCEAANHGHGRHYDFKFRMRTAHSYLCVHMSTRQPVRN